ncbi:hypothetical protein EBZ39_02830 [bacterium]|nr:hypothetical protein [bacterium]
MDTYALTQRDRDQSYRRAYDEWIYSLSPEERDQLEELGVHRPSIPGCGSGAPSGDLADSPLAQCEPAELEVEIDDDRYHDLLRRLVGELLSQENARLSLECLALVTGLAYCGDSMTEIASRHGITRAAVSKRCVEFCIALNLKPSRAMRSVKARESYKKARLRRLNEN